MSDGVMGDNAGPGHPSLAALDPLAGTWKGSSTGTFGTATVARFGEFVLQGRFFRVATRSVSLSEVHEDFGIFGFDEPRGRTVLREFHSEGYVITYVMTGSDGSSIVFESEHIENPSPPTLRARLTIEVVGPDECRETLELATGDGPFNAVVELVLHRDEG